jgi:hypothetical protein
MAANRSALKTKEGKLIEGLQQFAAVLTSLFLQGKAVTVPQAIAILQARIDAITAAQAAKIAFSDAVRAQDQQLASTNAFVDSLVMVISGMYAGSPTSLGAFGLTVRKTPTLTVEQKALASEKRAATRKARNTMGKKQKAAIHGTVTAPAVTVGPLVSGSTPAATGTTPAPAATASPLAAGLVPHA